MTDRAAVAAAGAAAAALAAPDNRSLPKMRNSLENRAILRHQGAALAVGVGPPDTA